MSPQLRAVSLVTGPMLAISGRPAATIAATRCGPASSAKLRTVEERLRQAEERARIAEAKSAMLAANALKLETEASHMASPAELAALREENEAAAMLLAQVVTEINALADAARPA